MRGWLLVALGAAGCVVDDSLVDEDETQPLATCGAADAYTPYGGGSHPVGNVATYPWRTEDFSTYTPLPSLVECDSGKSKRSHLDVTSGCLDAVALSNGAYTRGLVTFDHGGFRALALGRVGSATAPPVKWLDQTVEFRFFYAGALGVGTNPGFKAFARYRSEDNLYVASWRLDGVVQIQQKKCGVYTTLALRRDLPAPTPRTWHRLKLAAIGARLTLSLDDQVVLETTSDTFSWGTAGIRLDGTTGTYLDDWRVF